MSKLNNGHAMWFVAHYPSYVSPNHTQFPRSPPHSQTPNVSGQETWVILVRAVSPCYFLLAPRWRKEDRGSMSLRLSSSWTLGILTNVHPYRLVPSARTASEQLCLFHPHNLRDQHPRPHHPFHVFLLPYSAPQTCQSHSTLQLPTCC